MTQADLFGPPKAEPRPDVLHVPTYNRAMLPTFAELRAEIPFAQRTARMYGRDVLVPRLEAWFGSRPYAFGGRVEPPRAFTPWVERLRLMVSEKAGVTFDSCFANLYRDGEDAISWHADDDDWIGPVIASLSFGAARRFVMKPKSGGPTRHSWRLADGDLFVMRAGVQAAWLHSVPREKGVTEPRINLTFRTTVEGK